MKEYLIVALIVGGTAGLLTTVEYFKDKRVEDEQTIIGAFCEPMRDRASQLYVVQDRRHMSEVLICPRDFDPQKIHQEIEDSHE